MPQRGWKQLLADTGKFREAGGCPILAYSEFMPPPRLGLKPYGNVDPVMCAEEYPNSWTVTEYEEAFELRPGLQHLAQQLVSALVHLGRGQPAHGIAKGKLADNPYWPPELARRAGSFDHERYVVILPLALSRTQDDKGRVRWTLFGGSEQGPARAFWKGFFTASGRPLPADQALHFFRNLLAEVYHESPDDLVDLRRAGFRILPQGDGVLFPYWRVEQSPAWTAPLLWRPGQSLRGVKYVLTFRPFNQLPAALQEAYAEGKLHLLPFPGSLVFWGAPPYGRLQQELPLAIQIPLLHSVARHEAPGGIRVPQSGWMHEPRPDSPAAPATHGPFRNNFQRTHRWARVRRDEDELALEQREEKLLHVLFSSAPDDVGLYGKPMARNVQLWTHDFHLLLDGPHASHADIKRAEHAALQGGTIGYRLQYPAMRVGVHEVYWHRPLVAYLSFQTGQPAVLPAPLGYLTAYPADHPDPSRPIELWPRLLQRDLHVTALHLFEHAHDQRPHQTARNIRKLLDTSAAFGNCRLPRSLARQLLALPHHETLDDWLNALPGRASTPEGGRCLVEELRAHLPSAAAPGKGKRRPRVPRSLTLDRTARRSFEVAYWKTIAHLAEGKYINKDNADCVRDSVTQAQLRHHHRDLEALGDYLLAYYRRTVAAARMAGKAVVGDLPFSWRTDFDFPWMGGWLNNQEGHTHERDLVVVIPGKDRRRAVIMADHYDTAYMEDHYGYGKGGKGPRLSAAGADDNHSATVTLMLAAPVFLALSRARKLACDIWLVHLTGEEFPADCMGARHLCQRLVEGNLKIRLANGEEHDLSRTRVQGVYVLDMVAHNNDHARDIFQIAPGTGRESLWLAYQAHLANEAWNTGVPQWNRRSSRRGASRGQRSPHGSVVPAVAVHPCLSGEVRLPYDPRSTLYNTDGQIFSDAGVPVVLFMENYDINRQGYHDSHDTMANIDLDYGSAVAAIAIESVARAATEKSGFRI
jgi:hypothetical protein